MIFCQTNPEIQAALDPCLRLASKIFMEHPIFVTLANVHKLRKVPWHRDGRTTQEIAEQGAFTSVWPSTNDPEQGVFDSARQLYDDNLLTEEDSLVAVYSFLATCAY